MDEIFGPSVSWFLEKPGGPQELSSCVTVIVLVEVRALAGSGRINAFYFSAKLSEGMKAQLTVPSTCELVTLTCYLSPQLVSFWWSPKPRDVLFGMSH